jgi:hypothetical protein
MDFEYELIKDDLVEYYLYLNETSKQLKKSSDSIQLLSFIIGLTMPIVGIISIFVYNNIMGIFPLIFGLCFAYLFWYSFGPGRRRKLLRKIVEKEHPSLPDPTLCRRKASITEDGYHEKTEFAETTLTWRAFREIRESPKYIFLPLLDPSYIMIPKRAFTDASALAMFSRLVKDYHSKTTVNPFSK